MLPSSISVGDDSPRIGPRKNPIHRLGNRLGQDGIIPPFSWVRRRGQPAVKS